MLGRSSADKLPSLLFVWESLYLPSFLKNSFADIEILVDRVFFFCYNECECKVSQSCPTLCNPVDCSLPGSSVNGILQARILEWVAISFSISYGNYNSVSKLRKCLVVKISFDYIISSSPGLTSFSWEISPYWGEGFLCM